MYLLTAITAFEVCTPIEPNVIQQSKSQVCVFLCTYSYTHKAKGSLTTEINNNDIFPQKIHVLKQY